MSTRTFYKLDIQGIVYLVDPITGRAYTYDIEDPVEIGTVTWTNPKIGPTIALNPDWLAVMSRKQMTLTHKFAATHTPPTTSNDDAIPSSHP
jgi:hypothetical protein